MFKAVLVANRGEIAVRVLRACREVGIRGIAVYSEADRDAAHVRAAETAICIGPAPARESYLDIARLLAAARATGAEAIHPGYGFLSENADFAAACRDAGIVFIGPPAEVIRRMGSKTAAKQLVAEAGVPTVPGYAGTARDAQTLARAAARIGYPVLVKAAAGGGGKGMRVVHAAADLADALASARREAQAAFGDDALFLERLLVDPRHVEIQVLADAFGTVLHLGERECSIQRRHQKVLEESPSPALTPELRARMGEAAVRVARASGYVNAGTCEFLLDRDGNFYFLEMNTRLQVEHPVTESVTGLDLVHLQLEIAAGLPLRLRQEDISPRGHAIEVRLYAEDPANDYLPSTGTLAAFAIPTLPGLRVDAGVATGDDVTMHYDPLLAKLIVSAPSREAAVQRLAATLEQSAVLGVRSNLGLLHAIACEPEFRAGQTDIGYLARHSFAEELAPPTALPWVLVAAALWQHRAEQRPRLAGPYNPWVAGDVRPGGERRFTYRADAATHMVVLRSGAAGSLTATVDGAPYPAEGGTLRALPHGPHDLLVLCGEAVERYVVARQGAQVLVGWRGQSYTLALPQALEVERVAHTAEAATGRQALTAPMAGTVLALHVREGEQVRERQPLVVLGAMKMEHALLAPYAGIVRRLPHAAGSVVPGGAVLVEIEAIPQAASAE